MAGRKTDAQILDEILAERAMGKAGDPVAEAKRFLSRPSVVDERTESQSTRDAMARVAPGALEQYGPVIGETATEAAPLLGSVMSGPIGLAAGAYQAYQAGKDFLKDPSLLGGAATALGVLPALRSFGRMGKTAGALNTDPVKAFRGVNMGGAKPTRGVATAISHNEIPTSPMNLDDALADVRFSRQTPEVISDFTDTVSAPGFDLGSFPKSLDDVPTAKHLRPTPAPESNALASMQRGGIDWRTTDAVPIDAMTRPGILEAGESRIGLAEQLAEVMKTGDLGRAAELAKAIRQRMHIGASGR